MIGGAQIFQELLPRADILHVTYVHAEIDGDTFFPKLSPEVWLSLIGRNSLQDRGMLIPCPSSP